MVFSQDPLYIPVNACVSGLHHVDRPWVLGWLIICEVLTATRDGISPSWSAPKPFLAIPWLPGTRLPLRRGECGGGQSVARGTEDGNDISLRNPLPVSLQVRAPSSLPLPTPLAPGLRLIPGLMLTPSGSQGHDSVLRPHETREGELEPPLSQPKDPQRTVSTHLQEATGETAPQEGEMHSRL